MSWRRKARTPRAMTAITWLLAVAILGTWGISMACLTVVTAQEIYDRLYELSYDFPREVSDYGRLEEFLDKSSLRYGDHRERPDDWENRLLQAISSNITARCASDSHYGSGERSKLIRDVSYPMETAVLFYDGDGNLLHSSGEDILFFSYFTQAEWDAGVDTASGHHYSWIDVSEGKDAVDPAADPWGRLRESALDGHFRHIDLSAMRITGFFDGTELIPVTVHYVTDNEVWPVVERNEQFSTGPDSDEYTISAVDRTGELAWQLLFDRSGDHRGQPLVTVYVERPEMYQSQGTPLTYGGQRYESLTALTEELDFPAWASVARYSSQLREAGVFRLKELLVFSGQSYADYQNFDYSAGGAPETEWTMVTAVRSRPLACAVSALRNLYIGTGLLALGLLLAVRRSIKKRLVQPVAAVAEEMAGEWNELRRRSDTPPPWRETAALAEAYGEERDRRRMKDNELARLDTALAYAREAEQNRRQMTSHMAHELKTPLAVTHSYAEGLREHIAEEKREKYIDVILAETERMDAMVLEMLDLSRLEAGKVKLARDDFSLVALTESIFAKLDRVAQGKGLEIIYSFPADFTITADEGRIAQVVENFAANAVKYTPPGGQIRVKIRRERSRTVLRVENDSEPLGQEALERVWDAFYRTDEARSGGGTGLGLAIARQIVELHGGKCWAENTPTGVAFSFSL